jgi:hypothetical protein
MYICMCVSLQKQSSLALCVCVCMRDIFLCTIVQFLLIPTILYHCKCYVVCGACEALMHLCTYAYMREPAHAYIC